MKIKKVNSSEYNVKRYRLITLGGSGRGRGKLGLESRRVGPEFRWAVGAAESDGPPLPHDNVFGIDGGSGNGAHSVDRLQGCRRGRGRLTRKRRVARELQLGFSIRPGRVRPVAGIDQQIAARLAKCGDGSVRECGFPDVEAAQAGD